jgi:phage terminase small subunit
MTKLTPKQMAFCHEYLIDKNATQAAIRAGYSESTARQIANENLTKPDIRRYLDGLLAQRAERARVSGDEVIEELAAIGFAQITDVLSVKDGKVILKASSEWPESARKSVESARETRDGVSVKMHSKLGALEKLGQHFGVFNDFNAALATLSRFGYVMTKGDRDVDKGFTWQPELSAEEEDEDDEPTASIG